LLIRHSCLLLGSVSKCLTERLGLASISSYGIPKTSTLIGPSTLRQPIGPDEELLVWYNGEDNPEIAAALEEERTSNLSKKSSPRAKRGKMKTPPLPATTCSFTHDKNECLISVREHMFILFGSIRSR